MQLTTDGDFIERQKTFVECLIRAIRQELEDVDAPPEVVQQLTGSIAFAVASLIDGTSSAQFQGEELNPHLAFRTGPEELLYAGGNTWMHEYVYLILPSIFPAV